MAALVHFFALLATVSNTVLTLSIYGVELKFIFAGLIVFDILVHYLVFASKTTDHTLLRYGKPTKNVGGI